MPQHHLPRLQHLIERTETQQVLEIWPKQDQGDQLIALLPEALPELQESGFSEVRVWNETTYRFIAYPIPLLEQMEEPTCG